MRRAVVEKGDDVLNVNVLKKLGKSLWFHRASSSGMGVSSGHIDRPISDMRCLSGRAADQETP